VEVTSVEISQRFDKLDKATRAIVRALTQSGDGSVNQNSNEFLDRLGRLDTQIYALIQMMSHSEIVLMDARMRTTIVDTCASQPVENGTSSAKDRLAIEAA
jgi:hypothetical protein